MALIRQLQGFIYWKELTFNYVYEISPEVLHQWALTQRLEITNLCRIHQFCSPDAVFVAENKAVYRVQWESKGDVWWAADERCWAGSSPAPLRRRRSKNATSRQLATKAGGWQGDQMRQTEEALCQTAVTARGLCLTAAGSLSAAWWSRGGLFCQSVWTILKEERLHGAAFLGFSFIVCRELFEEEAITLNGPHCRWWLNPNSLNVEQVSSTETCSGEANGGIFARICLHSCRQTSG